MVSRPQNNGVVVPAGSVEFLPVAPGELLSLVDLA